MIYERIDSWNVVEIGDRLVNPDSAHDGEKNLNSVYRIRSEVRQGSVT